ncbi:hypothetical protein DYB30_002354 [Aphanomyces astaci]|uniref:Protein kinase domain-containing protein n=1 Tax=Aphanomyces astaci TaxID=112090 RepID=A0A397DDM3_APHAT|nr:hypothetical protein DYB30_002354 [Aphanomyces astaci]
MPRLSEADEAVLAKDREEHPECTHSTTISSSCRSINGDRQCETLRRIFRKCPGRQPALILDVKDQTQDNSVEANTDSDSHDAVLDPFQLFRSRGGSQHDDGGMSPFRGGFMGQPPHPFESMDDIMQEMLRPFGFGSFGFGPSDNDDNGVHAPYLLANKPPDSSDDEDDDVLSSSIPEDRELPQHHARGQLRRKSSSSRLSVSRAPFRTSLDPSVEEQNHDKSRYSVTYVTVAPTQLLTVRAKFTLDDFKYTDKKLGFGKFGYVYLAKQRTAAETEVALKVQQQPFFHPHILRLYRYFHEDSLAYLVLEYAPHGSLQRLLSDQPRGYFAEAVAVAFVLQVVRAVQYLHARHVIHRDIKPENLLLGTLDTIKVADFGLAIHAPPPNRKRRHFCGTPEYMSPEIVDHQEYSVEVDVWSVGIVAYELLVGHTPFRGDVRDSSPSSLHVVSTSCCLS